MIISIDNNTPTSALLDIKIGATISNGSLNGRVEEIKINDTDEFWLFIFYLEEKDHIEVMKIKNIC